MKEPAISVPKDCHEVLLHACCAPCSSAIVEWLMANGVRPTIFYYNPNIWPREEYEIRKNESKRHAEGLGIKWIDGDYDHEGWLSGVCGLENQPERGLRCEQCFTLRLTAAARKAKELGIRVFATTLASSRWKSLEQITRAGKAAEEAVGGSVFWAQNWRKGGLQERRNQLLREYGFYNQQYCGCEFSVRSKENSVSSKESLRQQMREAKQQYAQKMAMWSAEIADRLWGMLHSAISRHPSTILAYWPLKDEVDIRMLTDRLVAEGHTVLLPKVTGKETMELRHYTSRNDLAEGAFHIMEPTGTPFTDYGEIDLVLVPGVAFDAAGHRLGRGRGYYDRFLAAYPEIYKIGVCFPFQRVAEVPAEPHDISVNELV